MQLTKEGRDHIGLLASGRSHDRQKLAAQQAAPLRATPVLRRPLGFNVRWLNVWPAPEPYLRQVPRYPVTVHAHLQAVTA